MIDFKIDNKKCTQCNLCAQECPVAIIELDSFPKIKDGKEQNCLKCQHCLAVCPTGALSILGKNPADSLSTKDEMPTPETLARLIKTRRSIRKFKQEEIGSDLINNLLDVAAHAPTGHNANAVHFHVIETKEQLSKLRDKVYTVLQNAADKGQLSGSHSILNGIQKVWFKKGVDVIFRDAPHLVITSAPKAKSSPVHDSVIALSYFELIANTYGIGTLWNGMIKWTIDEIAPELKSLIGIPEDHAIGYVMLFGKSAVKFARSIQSDGGHINKISF